MRKLEKLKLPAKILLSALVLWLLATRIDWGSFADVFRRADYAVLASSFGVLLAQQFLMVVTWRFVIQQVSGPIGLWPVFYSHVIGNFWGTLLPTTLGIDVIRALSLRKFGARTVDSATTLLVTRAVGFSSLFFLAGSAYFFATSREMMVQFGPAILLSFLVFICCFSVMVQPKLLIPFEALLRRFGARRLSETVAEARRAFTTAFRNARTVLVVSVLSIIYQLLGVYVVHLLGITLNANVAFAAYLFVVPAVTIITAIPVAFAGLGVREVSFVVLLGQVGVPAEVALSVSLLFFAQALFLALLGGVVYWLSGIEQSAASEPAATNR